MRFTSEYMMFLDGINITDSSIVVGKGDNFYKGLNFSESDIELIRAQERDTKQEGGIDYITYVLNLDRDLANIFIPRVKTIGLGVLSDEIEHLIKLVMKAGDLSLPTYLILEQGFEFASNKFVYEGMLLGLNTIEYYAEGYNLETIGVIVGLLKEGIDIRKIVTKETVLDTRVINLIVEYFKAGRDFSNIIKYNMNEQQIRLVETLEKEGMDYNIEDCLQNWSNYEVDTIVECLESGNNIMPYINFGMTDDQIEQVDYAMTNDCDIKLAIKHNLSRETMSAIRDLVAEGIDIKKFLEEGFTGGQAVELGLGLKEGLDITPFKNLRYTVTTMRNLRLIALEDKQGLSLGALSRDEDNYEDVFLTSSEYEYQHPFNSRYDCYQESEVYQLFKDKFKVKLG